MPTWKINKYLFIATDLLIQTFLAFFIWEKQEDLYYVLLFALAYNAMLPLASLISGVVTDILGAKLPLLLSIWAQIALLAVIIAKIANVDDLSLETVAFIGIIAGLAQGLKSIPYHSISFHLNKEKDLTHYYASKNLVANIFHLTLPITAAFIISQSTNGYANLFAAGIGLLIFQTILTILYDPPIVKNTFELKSILTVPGTNPSKAPMIKAIFLEGLSEGIILTLLPIIVLVFVGSVFNWGLLQTAVLLFSLSASFFFVKYTNDINSKVVYAIGGLIFAFASIFLFSNFTLVFLIGFLFAQAIVEIIKEVNYHSAIDKIMQRDRKEYKLHSEYQFLHDTISSIGRLIPVLILIYLQIDMNDDLTLRIVLLLAGLLPLLTLSLLNNSTIFTNDGGDSMKLHSIRREQQTDPRSLPSLSSPETNQPQV